MINKIVMTFALITNAVGTCANDDFGDSLKEMIVINEYSKELKEKLNIQRRSYGFRSTGPDKIYHGKIHGIVLDYSIDANLKFAEARKLYYKVVDGFIERINSHKELADLFYHYPIGYEDLEIGLSFDYESKGHLKKGDVDLICILDNKIKYFIVENERDSGKAKMRKISPESFLLEGFGSRTKAITRKLPETDLLAGDGDGL